MKIGGLKFEAVSGRIVIKKAAKRLNLEKWKGRCAKTIAHLGYSSVDEFVEDIRGR